MLRNILVPLTIVIAAVAFLDPFMVLMPGMMVYTLLGLFLVVFLVYALLIFQETAHDEREAAHRAFAGRISYIAGTGVLVLGITYQVLVLHHVEPLLVYALVAMTIAKYACIWFLNTYR